MGRRKVRIPRQEAWSTRGRSVPCDLQTTDVDAVSLHGSISSVSCHFGVPQYRSHAIRYPGKPTTRTCSFDGDGGFLDPHPAGPIKPLPVQPPSLQEPSASDGQVIA